MDIVDNRYVGVFTSLTGAIFQSTHARVIDARTGRRVHDSRRCDGPDEFSGPEEVAFLPGGGLVLACNQLLLYRDAGTDTPEMLEPPGTVVDELAVSLGRLLPDLRLFWRLRDGTVRFRLLGFAKPS